MNTEATSVASPVADAIDYLRDMFEVTVDASGDGGALVTVHSLEIGEAWTSVSIDLAFHIPFNYPFAPIYPYYTRPDLSRADGQAVPPALQRVDWNGAPHTQVSLRANRWNPAVDTAVGAVIQVQRWFRSA